MSEIITSTEQEILIAHMVDRLILSWTDWLTAEFAGLVISIQEVQMAILISRKRCLHLETVHTCNNKWKYRQHSR